MNEHTAFAIVLVAVCLMVVLVARSVRGPDPVPPQWNPRVYQPNPMHYGWTETSWAPKVGRVVYPGMIFKIDGVLYTLRTDGDAPWLDETLNTPEDDTDAE